MPKQLFDLVATARALENIATKYDKTAPVVSRWADEKGCQLVDNWRAFTLEELRTIEDVWESSTPNAAQNALVKHLDRTGQDTTGLAYY